MCIRDRFSTVVTLTHAEAQVIAGDTFTTALLSGEMLAGNVAFDLSAGAYTLQYATPWLADSIPVVVRDPVQAEMITVPDMNASSLATVTAHITNTGFTPISGTLQGMAAFANTLVPLELAPNATVVVPLSLDLTLAPVGMHPITVTLYDGTGLPLLSSVSVITVPDAGVTLTAIPTDTVVTAGQWLTLSFGVANQGTAPATALLTMTLGNFVDEAKTLWLRGGENGTLDFACYIPEGMSGDALVGNYWFAGQRYDLVLPIAGVDLDVQSTWDQLVYTPGTTATLSFTLTNQNAASTPPLEVYVAYADQTVTHTLTLAGSAVGTFDVELRAQADASPLVFYGVYAADEQRGIHLNTTYLHPMHSDVTVLLDRSVYSPGDLVEATLVTTATTGVLTVTAPGFTTALQLPAASFQFTLPTGFNARHIFPRLCTE